MNPTPGDVHVNVPLTNISIAMLQSANDFVASRVFPNIPVAKQSDRYWVYDRGEFNRDEMQERAPATESAGGGYSVDSTPTYYARRYSFHRDVSDEEKANADAALQPDRDATIYVTHKGLIKREKLFVNSYMKPGLWFSDIQGVASNPNASQTLKWTDVNSDPIKTIRDGKRAIRENTGFEPNKLVIGRPAYDALLDHPAIIDRLDRGQTPGGPARANVNSLAALFEIEEILVMNAIENTAKEGATPNHTFIGGASALLTHSARMPGLRTPSAGYTFSWTGLMGAGAEGNRIRRFRLEQLGCDRIEIDFCFDMKLIAADLGIYYYDLV